MNLKSTSIIVATILTALMITTDRCLGQNSGAGAFVEKDEITARKLSIKGTLYPVAAGAVIYFGFSDRFENWDDGESILAVSIAGFGLIFGPALGHCYAGQYGYITKGILLRGLPLGFIVMSAAMVASWGNADFKPAGMILPVSLVIASAIHDIKSVDKSVAKCNKHRQTGISVQPYYFADHNAPGLVVNFHL
jgi:hypothetical protein